MASNSISIKICTMQHKVQGEDGFQIHHNLVSTFCFSVLKQIAFAPNFLKLHYPLQKHFILWKLNLPEAWRTPLIPSTTSSFALYAINCSDVIKAEAANCALTESNVFETEPCHKYRTNYTATRNIRVATKMKF